MVREVSSDAELVSLVQSANGPVVIDFFATWCGPCKRIAPDFEALSNEFQGVLFLKANVEKVPSTQNGLKVTSLPTFIYISGGDVMGRTQGANINAIRQAVSQLVAAAP